MIDTLPSRTAASICCLQREADTEALQASIKVSEKQWDLGYARVHFEAGGMTRIVNRQGLTLAEGHAASLSQLYAFLLRRFW